MEEGIGGDGRIEVKFSDLLGLEVSSLRWSWRRGLGMRPARRREAVRPGGGDGAMAVGGRQVVVGAGSRGEQGRRGLRREEMEGRAADNGRYTKRVVPWFNTRRKRNWRGLCDKSYRR